MTRVRSGGSASHRTPRGRARAACPGPLVGAATGAVSTGTACDIMRPEPARRPARTGAPNRCPAEDPARAPAGTSRSRGPAAGGEGHRWLHQQEACRTRSSCGASPSGSRASSPTATSSCAVAPRRGARDRRRERRRQVHADEDPLRDAPARRGHDPARRPRGALPSPADAIAAGIGMVHQHFMLADNFTVLENIVLGSEPTRGLRLDRGRGAASGSGRSPTATPSTSSPTCWSRTSASATGSASRSPRCSTAGPDADPRRADRGAGAAGGRRAVRQPRASSSARA